MVLEWREACWLEAVLCWSSQHSYQLLEQMTCYHMTLHITHIQLFSFCSQLTLTIKCNITYWNLVPSMHFWTLHISSSPFQIIQHNIFGFLSSNCDPCQVPLKRLVPSHLGTSSVHLPSIGLHVIDTLAGQCFHKCWCSTCPVIWSNTATTIFDETELIQTRETSQSM